MESVNTNTKIFRYPGVKPFTTEEKDLFFGRDEDALNLQNQILARQIVVLFGKSGNGKSSLINAKIIPNLIAGNGFIVIKVRFSNYSPGVRDNNSLTQLVCDAIKCLVNGEPDGGRFLKLITNEKENIWYWVKLLQKQDPSKTILFCFDQFEELFTYPPENIKDFSRQLADVLYAVVPVKYRQKLEELEEKGVNNESDLNWIYEKPPAKVIFSIRSDRLSLLKQISDGHKNILENCFELGSISAKAARDAIIQPAQANGEFISKPFEYEPDVVDEIIRNIADKLDGRIEAAMLQILCRYIEEDLVIEQDKQLINREVLGEIGDVYLDYYENALNSIPAEGRLKIQQLIEEGLITDKQRNTLSENYISKEYRVTVDDLKILEGKSLIRKERDTAGRLLYEISHDTLVNPILTVAEKRKGKEEEERQAALALENERKQAVLEEQFRIETEKSKELARLNENLKYLQTELETNYETAKKNAKTYSKQRNWATILLGIAILFLGAAIIYYNISEREKEKSRNFFKTLNIQKANELLNTGNQYKEYNEPALANESYNEALKLLKNINDIPQGKGNTQDLNNTIRDLKSKIRNAQTSIEK